MIFFENIIIDVIKLKKNLSYYVSTNRLYFFEIDSLNEHVLVFEDIPQSLVKLLIDLLSAGTTLLDIVCVFGKFHYRKIKIIINELCKLLFLEENKITIRTKEIEDIYRYDNEQFFDNTVVIPLYSKVFIYEFSSKNIFIPWTILRIVKFNFFVFSLRNKNATILFKLLKEDNICLNCLFLWFLGGSLYPYELFGSLFSSGFMHKSDNNFIVEHICDEPNIIIYTKGCTEKIEINQKNIHPACGNKKHQSEN